MNDINLKKPEKKKKKKIPGLALEDESDHPVHEDYAKLGNYRE